MAKTFERNVKGLLGTKLGMTQLWDENNKVVPVTVIAAATNVVTQVRQPEVDGYNAIQVGFGEIEARKVNSPEAGHFAKAGVTPRRHLAEIRTADAASYTVLYNEVYAVQPWVQGSGRGGSHSDAPMAARLDVDPGSFNLARSSLSQGYPVPAASMRKISIVMPRAGVRFPSTFRSSFFILRFLRRGRPAPCSAPSRAAPRCRASSAGSGR